MNTHIVNQEHAGWGLFVRSLLPSAGSIGGSFFLTILIIGFHALILSREANLFLPHLAGTPADDQLADLYAARIVQPLDNAFGNSFLSTVTTAFVWGVIGWVIYTVLDFAVTTIRDIRSSNNEINMQMRDQVTRHPLHRQMVIRLLWRFLVGMLVIVACATLLPVMGDLLRRDILLLQATSGIDIAKQLGIAIFGWVAIMHVFVVLLRLFVLRTRVFGEILY